MTRLLLATAVLVALASPTIAQQPVPGRAADPALNPVPTDAFAFASVKVSKLWDNPAAKPLRDWVATQKDGLLESFVGVPFADIDRVTFVMATANTDSGGAPIVLVTTRQQYNEAKVIKALAANLRDGRAPRVKGRMTELSEGPFRWVVFVNERTLLYLPKDLDDKAVGGELIARLIARKADGPLAAALIDAQAHDVTVGIDLSALEPFGALLQKDEDLAPFRVLLQAKTAVLTVDVDKTARGKLVMAFPDAATAKRAAPVLEEGMKMLVGQLGRGLDRPRADPSEKLLLGWGVNVLKSAKVSVEGSNVVASADVPFADEFAKFVTTMPKSLKTSVDDASATNNLKQLGIAMHNMLSVYDQFPSDVAPGGDKPLAMSWRVQTLPYIEQDNLYKQLDHTKPWDDPANLKLLQAMEMPKVFEHPGRPAPKGHTYFRVFSLPKNAKGTDRPFFKEGERGPKITSITDGTSNTFLIVEAGEAVPWYKPDVLAYDGKLPLPQLGDKDADACLVLFGDGSVRKIKPSKLGEKTLRALITINGGEVIADLDK